MTFPARVVLAGCLAMSALGVTVPPAPGQESAKPFGQGTHALRALLKTKFNAVPLTRSEFDGRIEKSEFSNVLLVVLGDSGFLNESGKAELQSIVQEGGAVFVATDQRAAGALKSAFGVEVTGGFLQVKAGSPQAYRGFADCPLIVPLLESHPIFRTIRKIATNRPSNLALSTSRRVQSLALFPGETHFEKGGDSPRQAYCFAAGGEVGAGKVLVLSDHSVFINDMMLQVDNHNIDFARNCLDWLTDSGKRNQVLFVEDGEVITDFNLTLKEPLPPLPLQLPSESALIQTGNELLANLDVAGGANQLINDRVPHETILLLAVVLVTALLLGYGLWRLAQARHRLDGTEPRLSACLAAPANAPTLIQRRNLDMSRQNNYWETAHQLARQCFEALLVDADKTGGRRSTLAVAPRIKIGAGWWRRRAMKRRVTRLWRLAAGQVPEQVTADEFRRLQHELREIRTALDDGTLQLSVPVARRV